MNMNIFESDLLPLPVWATRAEDKLDLWEQGIVEGRSTGFTTLDPYLRLINSELTLIAARPSMGKTSLAMQWAENVARDMQASNDDGCVAVFSAEMSGTELYIRMSSAMSGVNVHRLRMGKGTPEEIGQMRSAMRKLKTLPIAIDDSSSPSTKLMLQRLETMNKARPVRLMLFDFVELGSDEARTEEQRISNIYKSLKAIAKTLDIPVVALSQLNRSVEDTKTKIPTMSDIRYSGMAEQVADKIVFIMRPEYYIERGDKIEEVPEDDKKGIAYIQVSKNRNGPVGKIRMRFIKERSMFADMAQRPI